MRTYVFDTCDQDPICGVSPFVGADVFPITTRWKKCEWKIKETFSGPFSGVMCVVTLRSENGLDLKPV